MTRKILLMAATAALPLAALPASAQGDAPLIPREKLFGNPSRTGGAISPDGNYLSWIAPRDGVMNVWVAPVANPNDARALTNERERPIRQYYWAPDSKSLLFVNDKGGDENYLLYGVDIASGRQRLLTLFEKTNVRVEGISSEVKGRILIGANNRDPKYHDIYSLDLASGKLTPVLMNEGGFAEIMIDEQLNPRLATKARGDGGNDYYRIVDGRVEATPFEQIGLADFYSAKPFGFTADGKTLYWADSKGRNAGALVAQDFATGAKTLLAEDKRVDITRIVTNPRTGKVEAYGVNYLKNEWVPVGGAIKGDLDFLGGRLKGEVNIASRSDADDKWIVTADPVSAPASAYLYDRKAKSLTKLYDTRPELAGAPLAPMHPVEIRTRDGLNMVSYLTLPPGSDADGDGRPDKKVPMVLYVHGGPWGRDNYGYSGTAQWLANRGYAVLQPNFRASTGFGKTFMNAGDLGWGTSMHDDLIDASDWAVKNGIATADKIAIMGISYGGYATLAGLAFTPDAFACGVEAVGPSNLNTLLNTIPPYWVSIRAQFYQRMGNPDTEEGRAILNDRSPLFKAARIKRPLLIGQGKNDPRVNVAESEQIVDALKTNNIPVTYLLFPDEGHGFARPQNNIAYNAVAENFLAKCLGGRAEPIGDALKASTMRVEYGAEFAPGLAEAMAR